MLQVGDTFIITLWHIIIRYLLAQNKHIYNQLLCHIRCTRFRNGQFSIYCMYACMYINVLYVNCTEQYCWWKIIGLFSTNYFLTATALTPSTGKVSEHGSPDSHFCLSDCSIIVKTVVNSLEFKVIHFFFILLPSFALCIFPSPLLFSLSHESFEDINYLCISFIYFSVMGNSDLGGD